MQEIREDEQPLLTQEQESVTLPIADGAVEQPNLSKKRVFGLLGLVAISLMAMALWMVPSRVDGKRRSIGVTFVSVEGVSEEQLRVKVQLTHLPRPWLPIRAQLRDIRLSYEGKAFAACFVPTILLDMYTPHRRTVTVDVEIVDPTVLGARVSDRLQDSDKGIEVAGKIWLGVLAVSFPVRRLSETVHLGMLGGMSVDDLAELVEIDIPAADDVQGLTLAVKTRKRWRGAVQVPQASVVLAGVDGNQLAVAEVRAHSLDLSKPAMLLVNVKPIDREALFDTVADVLEGKASSVKVQVDTKRSDPILSFLANLTLEVPVRMAAMQTVEEIQLIRKRSDWLPRGAAVFSNPFSANLTLLSLTDCKVHRTANGKLFASIDEPHVEPPIHIPGNVQHYRVDQSMNGKFEGSLMDLMRTIRELYSGNGTAYFDVDATVTLMLDRFHVRIRNHQAAIPIRMLTED